MDAPIIRIEVSEEMPPPHPGSSLQDVTGRRLRELLQGSRQAGEISLLWDGQDNQGRETGSGVYFLTVSGNGRRSSHKLVLLRWGPTNYNHSTPPVSRS